MKDLGGEIYGSVVAARKNYQCGVCGRPITSGDRYERTTTKFSGCWSHRQTCLQCVHAGRGCWEQSPEATAAYVNGTDQAD